MADSTPKRLALPSGPWGGFVGVFLLFAALIGSQGGLKTFLSLGNLEVMLHEGTIPAVVALGMLLVLISGGIDLSVGAVVALVTVVTMRVYTVVLASSGSVAEASLAAAASGVVAGGVCGLANGLLVTRLRLPPFVATLGMFGVARGLAVWLAERTTLAFPGGVTPDWVVTVGKTSVLNPGLWSLVVLAGLVAVLLHLTVFGRHLYAVGSNEATARLCGVNVGRTKVDVITAVVIGGASLAGGRGTVVGALLGVAILGLIKDGVSLFNVPVEMQYILIGVLLLANVALGRWRGR